MSRDTRPTREEIRARYGLGTRIRDDVPREVLVWQHQSQEAAEAYAWGNREHHGHPAYAELREGVGWVSVCDLRPAIEAAQAELATRPAHRAGTHDDEGTGR